MPLPIEASPAIFIRYKTQPNLVNTIISSPEMEVRQGPEGTLLAAVVGRLASEEIIDNTLSPALAPCHPKRFFRT
ncbi:hypothetical protein D3C87_1602080 [compost metagenome]